VSDRSRLIELLLEGSIQHGDFLLASGRHSNYYIDARRTTMSAEGLALVGRLGLSAIRDAGWSPDAVGGLTLGADPVAYAIAAASIGDRVVVVEDVITTGNSARWAIAAAEEAGAVVLGVLGVVDRLAGGRELLEADGRVVVVLTTIHHLGLVP
jgi:orotate phosphoribosyltransferase